MIHVSFQAHIDLLHFFLGRRDEIVERIETVLNAQRKPTEYLQDGALLSRHFEDCFFTVAALKGPRYNTATYNGVTDSQSRLRGQLEEAHWARGFRPRPIPGLHNGPADPAEMMMRAFYLWRQTRWPGRNGRVRYAHTLFNLYVIRCLELLSMRLWDADAAGAGDRLAQVQDVLDELWKIKTADQPVLVKDARWLIQTAQSLATDDLGAYFDVAERIAATFSEDDRIEIHKAGVRMAAGHLRSQIRYHSTSKALSFDDKSLVLNTRDSNALDFALLIQDLVPLLEAYEDAWRRDDSDDSRKRLELADAICQGISPDPELFLNRVELLGAYSMLDHLFITTDADGHAVYTPMGRRHFQLLEKYAALMARVATPLHDDCLRFRPVAGAYSPYGVLYGFSADLLKHMVLKASQPDAVNHFGLEDVFAAGDVDSGKLAWVNGWRKLPHLTPDAQRLFDYPRQFAEDIFDRIEQALRSAVLPTGRLFILAADDAPTDSKVLVIPEPYDETQRLSDWQQGKFVLSYETPDGWRAITKTFLTEVLGAGRDAKIVGLPPAAAGVLTLMCPQLRIVRTKGHTQ